MAHEVFWQIDAEQLPHTVNGNNDSAFEVDALVLWQIEHDSVDLAPVESFDDFPDNFLNENETKAEYE